MVIKLIKPSETEPQLRTTQNWHENKKVYEARHGFNGAFIIVKQF